jgi:hypothetical protein
LKEIEADSRIRHNFINEKYPRARSMLEVHGKRREKVWIMRIWKRSDSRN